MDNDTAARVEEQHAQHQQYPTIQSISQTLNTDDAPPEPQSLLVKYRNLVI